MSGDLVLDTGALIALQRDLGRLRALIRRAAEGDRELRTSSPVITEFVGGSPRALRRAAEYVSAHLEIAPVDEALARRAASLTQAARDAGPRAAPSAVDALVAAEAEERSGAVLFDGDRADFEALARASGELEIVALSDLGR